MICLFVVVVGATYVYYKNYFYAVPITANLQQVDVAIDAGHGSWDGGATGVSGVLEKDLNLALAFKVKACLEAGGVSTVMTREADSALEMEKFIKRKDMFYRRDLIKASGAKLFISIHMNTFQEETQKGIDIYYSMNVEGSKAFADLLGRKFQDKLGNFRGLKQTKDDIFLLKNTSIPSVLIECGYISNAEEEAKLRSEEYQLQIAEIISSAAKEWVRK